jgi:tetratricopeptide (TPR) repeat protein
MKHIIYVFAALSAFSGMSQSAEFKRNFEDGNMKYKVKSYTLAIPSFDKAIATVQAEAQKAASSKTPLPADKKYISEAYAKRGACYFQTGNTGAMSSDAEMALACDPDNIDAKALRAAYKHKTGDKKAACKEIRQQVTAGSEVAPKIFEECFCWSEAVTLAKEGDGDANFKRYDEAIKKLNEAAEILPDSGFIYASRAKAYLGKNEPEKALADMNLAIAKKASTYKVYYTRAQVYIKASKPDSAFLDLNKCLDLKPDYYDGYILRAEVNEDLEQWNAAVYDYKQLIKMRPDFGMNYYKCALVMHNHQNNLVDACDMYKAAAGRGVEEAKEMAGHCNSPKYMKQHLKTEK